MPLNKQIHIYSVDTQAFYTPEEKNLHRKMIRYYHYKALLKKNPRENEKYIRICHIVNRKIHDYKETLKTTIAKNSQLRELSPDYLKDTQIISIFESTLTRTIGLEIDALTTDMFVVQTYFYDIIKDLLIHGFLYNKEKYRFYTASAGQIRTKKTVFIKESIWNQFEKSLMCGLTIEAINKKGGINVNKFLAYLALSNSATDVWENFDISRSIVVPDYESLVFGEVDHIDDTTYKISRRSMPIPLTHTDGCGMVLPKISRKNFMIRLPWIKGLLASFDFVKFIKEKNCSFRIRDIYGKTWDIIEDNIEIIFTKSQFKMYKYYENWHQYSEWFRNYGCQAGICNMEENYFADATMNYQMLQTLTDLTEDEIDHFLEPSRNILKRLSTDRQTMLNVFGVSRSNKNKTWFQQALDIYPELLSDIHTKEILKQIKKSLIKNYKSGKLNIHGKYTFLVPDLYAFCEFLFMHKSTPKGLLENGQVSCKLFENNRTLDCLRSPHLFREHAVRLNTVTEETSRWFKTNAIYTSTHDLISKMLQFDNDGDKSLVVDDAVFVNAAKRNMEADNIVPLFYEMKKAKPVFLDSTAIYRGILAAYSGGNIGDISNNITKIWNRDVVGMAELDAVRILCMENNFTIDYAKTLYKPIRPEPVDKWLSQYTRSKVPYFFIYAKDKTLSQVEPSGSRFMDSLDWRVKNTPMRFDSKTFGRFNYKNLLHNKYPDTNEALILLYSSLNQSYHYKISQKSKDNVVYIIKTVREQLLNLCPNETTAADILADYLYNTKNTPHKELLWSCFGNILVQNLYTNIPHGSILCDKCGARFIPNSNRQKYCCSCSRLVKLENDRKRRNDKRQRN